MYPGSKAELVIFPSSHQDPKMYNLHPELYVPWVGGRDSSPLPTIAFPPHRPPPNIKPYCFHPLSCFCQDHRVVVGVSTLHSHIAGHHLSFLHRFRFLFLPTLFCVTEIALYWPFGTC